MPTQLQHFLLVFDHDQARLLEEIPFGVDGEQALTAYAEKELQYQEHGNIEIVLIGSDSLETIKLTHANYFDGTVAVSKYLQGILSAKV
jgi:hypothetical protein